MIGIAPVTAFGQPAFVVAVVAICHVDMPRSPAKLFACGALRCTSNVRPAPPAAFVNIVTDTPPVPSV
jgi:hypothetical protein